MSQKALITLFLSVGSIAGGYVPVLFGAGPLSYWTIFTSAIGGILGIWAGYKLGS
jgi:hypothetical protein